MFSLRRVMHLGRLWVPPLPLTCDVRKQLASLVWWWWSPRNGYTAMVSACIILPSTLRTCEGAWVCDNSSVVRMLFGSTFLVLIQANTPSVGGTVAILACWCTYNTYLQPYIYANMEVVRGSYPWMHMNTFACVHNGYWKPLICKLFSCTNISGTIIN